jgi:hypothetical protein
MLGKMLFESFHVGDVKSNRRHLWDVVHRNFRMPQDPTPTMQPSLTPQSNHASTQ